jgi:PBSX family phage portal protein
MTYSYPIGPAEEEPEVKIIKALPRDRHISHEADPFEMKIDKVRDLDGLSPNFKRQVARLEKRLESEDGGAQSKQLEPQIYTAYATLDLMQPPHNVDYLSALYNVSPVLRSAIQAKVSATVGMGYDFVETEAALMKLADSEPDQLSAKRKKIRKEKSRLVEKIDSCNDEMTFTETLTRVFTDVETLGYGCLEVGRKVTGEIGYIGHLPAKTVRVRRKRDGYIQMIAEKAVFFRNFGDTKTANPVGNDASPNEIIFFVGGNYSPGETYYGIPGSVAAKQAIAGNEFSARFNLDYFENKALPRYVFVIKGGKLTESSHRDLAEFFETMKGQNHRTLIVPMPPDSGDIKTSFEMHPVETGVQDSSFINYRQGNLNEILMAYRVPANKIGLADGMDLASARDLSKNFSETVTRPEQKNIQFRINKIVSEWTDVLKIKLKETALSDDTELSAQDQVYLTFGVETPNDVRQRWGWSPLDNGDLTVTELQAKLNQDAADKAAQVAAQQQDKAAEMQANQTPTRSRDTARAANTSDKTGNARNEKGAGRAQS